MSLEKKSTASFQPLSPRARQEPTSDINELHARLHADPRFNPPTPSVWKRIALLVFAFSLLWLGMTLRKPVKGPEVVHTQRCVK